MLAIPASKQKEYVLLAILGIYLASCVASKLQFEWSENRLSGEDNARAACALNSLIAAVNVLSIVDFLILDKQLAQVVHLYIVHGNRLSLS